MAYLRTPVRAPRLTGRALRLVVALARGWFSAPLRHKFLKDLGIERLRAARLERPILTQPDPPARDTANAALDLTPLDGAALRAPRGFAFETARDIVAAYRAGTTTPTRVAERLLAAIEGSDRHAPPLRALIAHDPADVLRQARAAQERRARGAERGPLDGVPVVIKDEVDLAGYPTTAGTRFLGASPAVSDATSVARLRAAGALLFGKANMHEIGLTPTGLNPHHGACRNPYRMDRDSGGSSSGVAAAIAAGLCPLGLGADGGGSIRIPAAHCGLVGLKPTFGRVSEHGAVPLCWSMAHLGPIGATAADCALGYALIAGRDPLDPQTLRQPDLNLQGLGDGVRGVRLGVPRGWFEDADPEVVRACRQLLEALVEAGALVVEVEAPELELLQLAHIITITSEMLASQLPYLSRHGRAYGHNVQLILALAAGLGSSDYVQAQRVRAEAHVQFTELLSRVDVLVTPTSAITAPPIRSDALPRGESDIELVDALMRFVRPANFLGLPAISFPAGYDPQGLPIGFMALGRFWEETLLLRLACCAERLIERRAPQFHQRLLIAP